MKYKQMSYYSTIKQYPNPENALLFELKDLKSNEKCIYLLALTLVNETGDIDRQELLEHAVEHQMTKSYQGLTNILDSLIAKGYILLYYPADVTSNSAEGITQSKHPAYKLSYPKGELHRILKQY